MILLFHLPNPLAKDTLTIMQVETETACSAVSSVYTNASTGVSHYSKL